MKLGGIRAFITLALAMGNGLPKATPAAEAQQKTTSAGAAPTVLITALHYWGYEGNDDEAVQLTNNTPTTVTLDAQWALLDAGNHRKVFPAGANALALAPSQRVWIANSGPAFSRQFGFSPTLVYSDLVGTDLTFANSGGSVRLMFSTSQFADSANSSGGTWDGGSGSPTFRSMERISASAADTASNWASANPTNTIALDGGGNPITGTPRTFNSVGVVPTQTTGVVINEVAWGGTRASTSREWIELFNNSPLTVSISGWTLESNGGDFVELQGHIAPLGYFLLQNNANTFGSFSNGVMADQTATFSLLNGGEVLTLTNRTSAVVDALVYGNGETQPGWVGAALQPYTATQIVPADGQILLRKRNALDTDTAQDWVNDRTDPIAGRKPIYPGWRFEDFYAPVTTSGTISLTLAVAPDASFDVVSRTLAAATSSIDLESFTFEHARIGALLAAKAAAGVRVRVLLDGAPVGGLSDQTRYICAQISAASANSGCWFMRSDANTGIRTRYAFLHAKFAVIDDAQLLVSSENFGLNGLPDDDQADGTVGHRGVMAVVESPQLVARANAIFAADIDEANRDIVRWCLACAPFGPPAIGFTPTLASGGQSYIVRFAPQTFNVPMTLTLATSPESHVRAGDSILDVLNVAGAGDEVLVQQLDEPHFWGASNSNPAANPNVRLQAMLDAAARGASVRIVLDKHYDDASTVRSNFATWNYVQALAISNTWDVQVKLVNTTGLGVHNKMILARVGERYYSQIGSWNGTETSAKRNREMSLLIESPAVFAYLRRMFLSDLYLAQPIFLPLLAKDYATKVITYPLISEVLFNAGGASEIGREWIELVNPSQNAISLSGYKIGDAALQGGSFGDGMYAFPPTATLTAGSVILIAENAVAFRADWGIAPTYEIGNYDPNVPDLLAYTAWSTGTLSLANAGDEMVLLGPNDEVVDAVVWGTGNVSDTVAFTGTVLGGHTMQRWPPYMDTNNCTNDFRAQNLPSVGLVP